jgi:hypothetical protein
MPPAPAAASSITAAAAGCQQARQFASSAAVMLVKHASADDVAGVAHGGSGVVGRDLGGAATADGPPDNDAREQQSLSLPDRLSTASSAERLERRARGQPKQLRYLGSSSEGPGMGGAQSRVLGRTDSLKRAGLVQGSSAPGTCTTLWVGGIPHMDDAEAALRRAFGAFGDVRRVFVRYKPQGHSWCLITFSSSASAERALVEVVTLVGDDGEKHELTVEPPRVEEELQKANPGALAKVVEMVLQADCEEEEDDEGQPAEADGKAEGGEKKKEEEDKTAHTNGNGCVRTSCARPVRKCLS